MYEIHIRGKKKAVLLAWNNAVGYGLPEITFQNEQDGLLTIHCELETKWDAEPYRGNDISTWDGSVADLGNFDEEKLVNGEYGGTTEGNAQLLSGKLDIEIQILNKPDDSGVPVCAFQHWKSGTMIADTEFFNPDCDMENDFGYDVFEDFDF